MSKLQVRKNVLNQTELLAVQSVMLGEHISWFYKNASVNNSDGPAQKEFFAHCFFNNYQQDSPHFDVIRPILHVLQARALIQVRANLETPTHEPVACPWHTDYPFECKTALFYVNTNNGCTEFKTGEKVPCIENQLAIFDSSLEHRSWSQTDVSQRVVINFNYFY